MEKILIKDAEQWGWWELASKTMCDDAATVLPCSDCDESVIAKEAMHGGWVRLTLVGTEEPETEPAKVEGGKFYCPTCQMKLGIDIEEGYAKKPVVEKDQSSRRGRGGRRNNSRREGSSGSGKNGSDKNKEKNNRGESKTAEGDKKSNGGNGSQRSGNRRGNGSRNRGRRSRRSRSKGANQGQAQRDSDGGSNSSGGSNPPGGSNPTGGSGPAGDAQ